VLGFVENLPFKDQAFDFVIAAHVLEHSTDPAKFLSELQRVAKAGYIEVPDAFMERINPYMDHRLEITCRDEKLIIRKKAGWRHDPEAVELYEDRVKPILTRDLIPRYPFQFHVRYYWDSRIDYVIVNPDTDAAWQAPASGHSTPSNSFLASVRSTVRDRLRQALSQNKRNASLDLLPMLRCTSCGESSLTRSTDALRCTTCATAYPVRNGVAAMNAGTRP
jgi:SAM-dependent methyltransferase